MHKPIFDVSMSAYPCYVCALKSEGVTCASDSFLTVSTVSIPEPLRTIAPY
jgi:hypothetical protein